MIRSASKVQGPFEILPLNELGEGVPILTLPFSEVAGSQLLVVLTKDATPLSAPGTDTQFWTIGEIGIWGSFQGYQSCIKRVALTSLTGPVSYRFGFDDAYDQIIVKARNMSGGRRGPGINGVVTQSNGYSLLANIHIVPRSGFRS